MKKVTLNKMYTGTCLLIHKGIPFKISILTIQVFLCVRKMINNGLRSRINFRVVLHFSFTGTKRFWNDEIKGQIKKQEYSIFYQQTKSNTRRIIITIIHRYDK